MKSPKRSGRSRAGHLGGTATLKKKGRAFFVKIGRKGGKSTARKSLRA